MKKLISVIAAALLLSAANVSAQLTTQRIVFDEKPSEYGYLAYKFVDENGNEIEPQYEESISLFSSLPSYYRNENLTPVKNQGSEGCCWAFAMVGAMEASLIQQGYATPQNIDLSEAHMAYFGKNLWDIIYNDGEFVGAAAYALGGNEYCALAAMSKGSGAVSESVAPYEEYTGKTDKQISWEKQFISEFGLSKMVVLDPNKRDDIKKAIMEYGCVLNAFYSDELGCYNPQTAAYYYFGEAKQNHQTIIVGWDDTYSKENFKEGQQPTSDGAWIVRNSWGERWGKNGYFYMSYETPQATTSAVVADITEYDNNYGYTGALNLTYLPGVTVASNIFTAYQDEVLEEISLEAGAAGNIIIDIYKGVTSSPQSGERTTMEYTVQSGYEKIKLEQPIELSQGERFSVVIRGVPVLSEGPESMMDISYNRGESFVVLNTNSGLKWVDAASIIGFVDGPDILGNFAIRAYTNDNKPKVTALINNEKILAESKYNDNAEIYIAQYDKNDVLIDVKKSTEASLKKNTTKYKVFSWNGKMRSTTETAFVKGVN